MQYESTAIINPDKHIFCKSFCEQSIKMQDLWIQLHPLQAFVENSIVSLFPKQDSAPSRENALKNW